MVDEWVSNFLDMTSDVELDSKQKKEFLTKLGNKLLEQAEKIEE
jgi:hypothetical protein